VPQTSDDFTDDHLGLQWQWRANENEKWYSLKNNKLRLNACQTSAQTIYDVAQVVTQKFPAQTFTATTAVSFKADSESTLAGLFVGGFKYGGLKLKKADNGMSLYYYNGKHSDEQTSESEEKVGEIKGTQIYLRVNVDGDANCQLSYSVDNKDYYMIDNVFPVTKGQWIGAQVGIFC